MKREYSSRKYKIAMIAFFLVAVGYGMTHFSDRLKESYFTFVGAIGTVLGMYGAANVGNKWVLAKNGILAPADNTAVVISPQSQVVQVPAQAPATVQPVAPVAPMAPVNPANPATGQQPLNPATVQGA